MIRRAAVLAYGAAAYVLFLAVFLYTIGFLAGVVVPKGVDDGRAAPAWQAVLVNLALLTVFAVQHSVMARPAYKQAMARLVPPAVERSTYVLAASAAVALLLWQWVPLPATVWSTDGPLAAVLWIGYLSGWVLLVGSTFMIGHFDLFGLRQVLARARERSYAAPGFVEPLVYRLIRHPLMTGFMISFWVVPEMSVGRLLFAAAATGYILVGVRLEEHDLEAELGAAYRDYARRTPRFLPRLTPARSREDARQHA